MMSSSDASAVEAALRVVRSHPDDLPVIVGPTASGKTALAVALAERLDGEVISADSVQIYRYFDIGSGKPTREQLATAPHHLVSEIDPMDAIDAVSWADRAARTIGEVRARGRVPIVCGGTFLWVKALVYGLADVPAASAKIRAVHRGIADLEGRAALHARLRTVDPESAGRLHPNDFVRVSRALEVCELTGKPMSIWQQEHQFKLQRRRARLLSLASDAATSTARIEVRVSTWLAGGWIDEVEALLARGFENARAMGSVGYAQVRAMLEGTISPAELGPAIVRATRVFARRQRTWLNHADVAWLS